MSTSPKRFPCRRKLPKPATRLTEYRYLGFAFTSCTRFMKSESADVAVFLVIRLAAEARAISRPESVIEYHGKGLLFPFASPRSQRRYPANSMALAISFARRQSYRNVSESQPSRNLPRHRRRISRICLGLSPATGATELRSSVTISSKSSDSVRSLPKFSQTSMHHSRQTTGADLTENRLQLKISASA
jgi:hypothetical protein